jgi:hypothetical protein
MGVLDALTILGAGIGRGYRGSQEIQRQLAEEKRKALLEEREQAVRERAAQAQEQLTASQVQANAVEMAMNQFNLGEKQKTAKRQATPITEGGAPLKLSILGQGLNLPGDIQSLTDQGDLIRQLSEEKFKSEHPGYFMNYPPAGTAAAQIKLGPQARKIDYLLKAAGTATAGGPGQFEDNDAYSERVARIIELIMNKFKSEDPEAFGDSTKVSGKGKNRFKVDVKPE